MTIAQQLEQRGFKKGQIDGIEKNKQQMAVKLLAKGMSFQEVSELTELPLSTLQELQKQLH